MKYKLETYKGVTLKTVDKIIGKRKTVCCGFSAKAKTYKTIGTTKEHAVAKAKTIIDRIL